MWLELLLYLAEGKFYVVCGKDKNKYLQINPFGDINLLSGVKDKHDASFFYVEQNAGKYVLAYDFEDGSGSMYMARNPEAPTEMNSIQMGGEEPAEFTLHHPGPKDATKDVVFWKKNPCYIKIENGYAAYNDEDDWMEFTEEDSNTEDLWLPCQLQELETGGDGMHHAPGGPRPTKKTPINRRNKPKKKAHQFGSEP